MADLWKVKEKLESNEAVVECLDTVNTLLIAGNSVSLASEILSTIPLSTLFSCLQTEDPEQVNVSCAVLEKLLVHLPASQLLQYSHYVELGLQYPEARVPKTCLQLLLRLCVEEGVGELILAPTMLHLITQLLGGKNLQCASLAANVLLHFSSQCRVLDDKLKNVWFSELDSLLQGGDTVRYRVYDLVVKTCLQGGAECFTILESAGYLDQLVKELGIGDPLVKMNCIELLSCLVDSPNGLSFLQSSQVLDKLYGTLTSSEQDLILIPGKVSSRECLFNNYSDYFLSAILKFFGQLCISTGAKAVLLFDRYPHFLHFTLEAALSPNDDTVWGVAMDTFGLLASTLSGRTLLISEQGATEQVLHKLGELIAVSSTEIRCRSLGAIKMMVSCNEDSNWEVSISRQWFAKIHHHLLQLLLSIVRQPFADLRLAGLVVLVELSAREWGQKEMQACPGFLEYLLDKNSEPDKDGKELKYEVVYRIIGSECGETLWGKVDMLKMKIYLREGPYYHTGDTTVAVEGAS